MPDFSNSGPNITGIPLHHQRAETRESKLALDEAPSEDTKSIADLLADRAAQLRSNKVMSEEDISRMKKEEYKPSGEELEIRSFNSLNFALSMGIEPDWPRMLNFSEDNLKEIVKTVVRAARKKIVLRAEREEKERKEKLARGENSNEDTVNG